MAAATAMAPAGQMPAVRTTILGGQRRTDGAYFKVPVGDAYRLQGGATIPDSITFCRNPRGTTNADGWTEKTEDITNMEHPSQLEPGRAQLIEAIGVTFLDTGSGSGSNEVMRLLRALFEDTYFEFTRNERLMFGGLTKHYTTGAGITGIGPRNVAGEVGWLQPAPSQRGRRTLGTRILLPARVNFEPTLYFNSNHSLLSGTLPQGHDITIIYQQFGPRRRPLD